MSRDLARQKIKTPATLIAVLAVISGLMSLLMAVSPMIRYFFPPQLDPEIAALVKDVPSQLTVVNILGIILHATGVCTMAFALSGAIHMLKLKSWKRAYSGGIMVCIPIFCLLFPIGIPLGIWGIRTIHKDGVREFFETSDATVPAEAESPG